MINSTDFRTGLTIEIDGNVWQIVDFQHVKPGKGAAFVRTKIKNVETGAVVERTFNPNEKMPAAHLETRTMQYLYEADGMYTFMDTETYEQSEKKTWKLTSRRSRAASSASACRTPLTSLLRNANPALRVTRLRAQRRWLSWKRAMKSAYRCSSTKAMCCASIPVRVTTSNAHN